MEAEKIENFQIENFNIKIFYVVLKLPHNNVAAIRFQTPKNWNKYLSWFLIFKNEEDFNPLDP